MATENQNEFSSYNGHGGEVGLGSGGPSQQPESLHSWENTLDVCPFCWDGREDRGVDTDCIWSPGGPPSKGVLSHETQSIDRSNKP